MSIPAGLVDGLPVGLQVLAGHHREQLLLDLALVAERVMPWPLVAPGSPHAATMASNAQRQRVAPGRHVEPGVARLHAGERGLVPVRMARQRDPQERKLARRAPAARTWSARGEAPERPGLVAAPAGVAMAERHVEHHPVRATDRCGPPSGGTRRGGRPRRNRPAPPRPTSRRRARHSPRSSGCAARRGCPSSSATTTNRVAPSSRGDVGQVDEELDLLVAELVSGHDQHVVRVVGVQQLVVARLLVRVLGRDDAHVEREVAGAEEPLGEVDDVVVQDERVEARAVERELRPGRVPRVPLARPRCRRARPSRRGWGSSGAPRPAPRPAGRRGWRPAPRTSRRRPNAP